MKMAHQPAFVRSHHPPDASLALTVGGGSGSVRRSSGGGAVALMLPSSQLREPNAVISPPAPARCLSTYTAGEDGGRLALLAKEFGLSRMRPPKTQVRRKHAFKAFLRNDRVNSDDEFLSEQSHAEKAKHFRKDAVWDDTTETLPSATSLIREKNPPLRFVFTGYSLWLDLEQRNIDGNGQGDLDRAMIDAADAFSLGGAIPSPHVTALYGINTISEENEMKRIFREDVRQVLLDEAEKRRREAGSDSGKLWPDLVASGIVVDAEFDGVNGGTMDMAWAEVSLVTSPDHEALIDALHGVFYKRTAEPADLTPQSEEKKEECTLRSKPWVPHLSICYDNPEGLGPNLCRSEFVDFLREKCPTLKSIINECDDDVYFSRAVTGISLWRTAGTMNQWTCLDRFEFPQDFS